MSVETQDLPVGRSTVPDGTAEPPAVRFRVGRWAATVVAAGRKIPVTLGALMMMLCAGIATGTLWRAADPEAGLLRALSFGTARLQDGQLWTFVTGAFVLPRPEFYPAVATILLFGLGSFERRLGPKRAAIALVGTQLVGTMLAALLVWPFEHHSWVWPATLADHVDLGLSAGALGVTGAATALFSDSWRRRVRFSALTFLSVSVLRSGLLWDVEHLLAFSGGILIGPSLAARPRLNFRLRKVDGIRIRFAVSVLISSVAVVNLIDLVYPGLGGVFGTGVPVHAPMHGVAVVIGQTTVALLVADALRRGRAAAWWVATIGTFVLVIDSVTIGPVRIGDSLCAAVVLILLLAYRKAWRWRSPDGLARRSLRRVAVAVLVFGTGWILLFWTLREHFRPVPGLVDVALLAMNRLALHVGPSVPHDALARTALHLAMFAWVVTLTALLGNWMYADRGPAAGARESLGRLLRCHGGGSLGWMRTWPAFSTWTTRDGQSAISYCVVGTVAIAIGDPVGPQAGWAAAVIEFRRHCRYAGWTPTWFAATAALLDATDGWHSVQIGEDTVMDLTNLEFVGKTWQDVRTARNRAAREGITMLTGRLADFPAELRGQIERISQEWVSGKALPEMGFTLGTVHHAMDPEMRTHVAVDDNGAVQGVTTWLPVHEDCEIIGWTLDLMRRRPDGFRPVMEYLIAESALLFKSEGYRTASLSVAPLARRSPIIGRRGMLDRALDTMSRLLEPTYGFQSLLAFKAKFHPEFKPVYLVYGRPADLPAISVAISRAYLPTVDPWSAAGLLVAMRRRSAQAA